MFKNTATWIIPVVPLCSAYIQGINIVLKLKSGFQTNRSFVQDVTQVRGDISSVC